MNTLLIGLVLFQMTGSTEEEMRSAGMNLFLCRSGRASDICRSTPALCNQANDEILEDAIFDLVKSLREQGKIEEAFDTTAAAYLACRNNQPWSGLDEYKKTYKLDHEGIVAAYYKLDKNMKAAAKELMKRF